MESPVFLSVLATGLLLLVHGGLSTWVGRRRRQKREALPKAADLASRLLLLERTQIAQSELIATLVRRHAEEKARTPDPTTGRNTK